MHKGIEPAKRLSKFNFKYHSSYVEQKQTNKQSGYGRSDC